MCHSLVALRNYKHKDAQPFCFEGRLLSEELKKEKQEKEKHDRQKTKNMKRDS